MTGRDVDSYDIEEDEKQRLRHAEQAQQQVRELYPINQQRVQKAVELIQRGLKILSQDQVAAILGEVGLWECMEWEADKFFDEHHLTLHLSDLQALAAGAAVAGVLDAMQAPVSIEVGS